jgi:hypothetical protein
MGEIVTAELRDRIGVAAVSIDARVRDAELSKLMQEIHEKVGRRAKRRGTTTPRRRAHRRKPKARAQVRERLRSTKSTRASRPRGNSRTRHLNG